MDFEENDEPLMNILFVCSTKTEKGVGWVLTK